METLKVEKQLGSKELLFGDIVESIQDGMVILSRTMQVVHMNSCAREWFGEDSIGRTCYGVFYGRDSKCEDCPSFPPDVVRKRHVKILRRPGPKGAAREWLEVHSFPLQDQQNGQLLGIVKYIRDITQRVKAERELDVFRKRLEINYHLLRAILDEEPLEDILLESIQRSGEFLVSDRVSLTTIDPIAGKAKLLFARNGEDFEELEREFDFDPQNAIHREMLDLADKGMPFLVKDLEEVGNLPVSMEHHRRNGLRSVVFQPLINKGSVFGMLSFWSKKPDFFCPDTIETMRSLADSLMIAFEKKRLNDMNREQMANLENLVSMRTKEIQDAYDEMEAFTYTVTHDLRAPLRALEGFANLLVRTRSDSLDPDARSYLTFIKDSARRMDGLIMDLLAYSRIGRADLQIGSLELGSVVKESLNQLAETILTSGASIKVEIPETQVTGHRQTLTQVVLNIVSNALKFVPPGRVPEISIYTEAEKDCVCLWFEDNGIGIAPEHHERIFQVFERLHGVEEYQGTGIGLAIARRGVQRMGGQVGVVSEEERGSRFWVRLPLDREMT